ncbi:hypothetical protein PHSC3_001760 [Chlamydiales bacterium STE3]|nr:hypothetical protein PHSC3_001760 [Chlamydiales bacterium STE3]
MTSIYSTGYAPRRELQKNFSTKSLSWRRRIVAYLMPLPLLALRIAAKAGSLFGKKGKHFSEKIIHFAEKLHVIYITHPLSPSWADSSLICRAKNVATKGCIWREEDIRKAEELIAAIPNEKDFDDELIEQLKTSEPTGAFRNGICLGASLFVIKELMKKSLNTEEKLIHYFQQFEEGFPAEASGIQAVFNRLKIKKNSQKFKNEKAYEAERNEAIKNECFLELERARQNSASLSTFEEIGKKVVLRCKFSIQERKYKIQASRFAIIASTIGLQLQYDPERVENFILFGKLEEDEVRKKFNLLKKGNYQLVLPGKENHSIVYIKRAFGSYLFDPNVGLIKCNEKDPSDRLGALLEKHYSKSKKFETLRIFKYRFKG